MEKLTLTARAVKAATRRPPFAGVDDVLHDACLIKYPHHKTPEAIWTKISLIGRVYAAAIERRKKYLGESAIVFFSKRVVPKVITSDIDEWIARVRRQTPGTPEALRVAIEVHGKVMRLFKKSTGLFKRSLASKYLHFHAPAHFFIYDSVAVAAMRRYDLKTRTPAVAGGDPQYAWFATRCALLTQQCEAQFGLALTPRQVDYLLLGVNAP